VDVSASDELTQLGGMRTTYPGVLNALREPIAAHAVGKGLHGGDLASGNASVARLRWLAVGGKVMMFRRNLCERIYVNACDGVAVEYSEGGRLVPAGRTEEVTCPPCRSSASV